MLLHVSKQDTQIIQMLPLDSMQYHVHGSQSHGQADNQPRRQEYKRRDNTNTQAPQTLHPPVPLKGRLFPPGGRPFCRAWWGIFLLRRRRALSATRRLLVSFFITMFLFVFSFFRGIAILIFVQVVKLSEWESTLGLEASALTAVAMAASRETSPEATTTTTETATTAHHAEQNLWVDATHAASHASHATTAEHVRHVDVITIVVAGSFSAKVVSQYSQSREEMGLTEGRSGSRRPR